MKSFEMDEGAGIEESCAVTGTNHKRGAMNFSISLAVVVPLL